MNQIRKNIGRPLLPAVALVLVGCATSAVPHRSLDVELFDGYRMGQFLDEPGSVESISDIPAAIDSPWYYDRELVTYTSDGEQAGPAFVLGSCAEYLAMEGQKVWPAYYPDGPAFMTLAMMCKASHAIASAKPAKRSYLQTLAFDRDLPDLLPWQVAMIISGSEWEQIATERPDASWREVLFTPLTGFSSCGDHCAVYGDEGGDQTVQLVARGDFSGDDIEDVLISSLDAVKGGSYRAVRMFVLTRRQADGEIELIRELDY